MYNSFFPTYVCLIFLQNNSFWINPLKPKLFQITFKNSVRTSQRTPHFTVTKINWLTLFKEIITVYSENHTKRTTQRGQLLTVRAAGTYRLWMVKQSFIISVLMLIVAHKRHARCHVQHLLQGKCYWTTDTRPKPCALSLTRSHSLATGDSAISHRLQCWDEISPRHNPQSTISSSVQAPSVGTAGADENRLAPSFAVGTAASTSTHHVQCREVSKLILPVVLYWRETWKDTVWM
jgi:hypothetical protein